MELVEYKKSEIILNSLSHALGAALFVFFGIKFLLRPDREESAWGFILYCVALFVMFFNSALYHGVPKSKFQYVMRAIDHSSIFLAIAGTYTPVLYYGLQSRWSLPGLIFIWLFAFVGIGLKIWAFSTGNVKRSEKLSMVLYLVMGWTALLFLPSIYRMLGGQRLLLLLLGGIFYTIGVFFYRAKKLPFNHFIWHMFILLASVTHFYLIWSL